MADQVPQNFECHTRWVPAFHFVLMPALILHMLWRGYMLWFHIFKGHDRAEPAINFVMAFAYIGIALAARIFALQAQDRVIRMEETLRMQRVLPDALKNRVGEIGRGQLIALRFAPDDELPGLVGRRLYGDLKDQKA